VLSMVSPKISVLVLRFERTTVFGYSMVRTVEDPI